MTRRDQNPQPQFPTRAGENWHDNERHGTSLDVHPTIHGEIMPAHSPAIAPTNVFQQHIPYSHQPLPLHAAVLMDHRVSRAANIDALQFMNDYHLWPGVLGVSWSALGWWAHTEPLHPLFASLFTVFGIASLVGGWLGHLAHGENADVHMTRGLGLAGVACVAGGAATGAGFSGISAMLTVGATAGGYAAWFGWQHHKLERNRAFVVDFTDAGNTGAPLPQPPVTIPQHMLPMSDEAARLHQAFAAMGISPITVDVIRRSGPDAWMTYVYLPESKTLSPRVLTSRMDALRNNLRCRSVSITPTAIGNRVQIAVQDGEANPLAETIAWPGPNTDDITQPINIGVFENGEPIKFKLAGRHTLYAGITEGGKSGGVNVAACSIAAMRNAVMVLIDLKPGQLELGPYESVAYRSAAGIADATLLLQALIAAMDERGQQLKEEREATGRPVRDWDPNNPNHGPAIVVVIDELAECLRLDPKVFELWLRIMQVGRALAIWILGATQSPSGKALGDTTDGSGQFTNISCFRTKSATQTNVVLGPGAHGDGWRADETTLPLKGMFLPRAPEYPHPQVGRGFWIDPDQVMDVIAKYEGTQEPLDERTAAAMERVLNGRCDPSNPMPPGDGQRHDAIEAANHYHAGPTGLRLVEALRYPDGSIVENAWRPLWKAFEEAESATINELVDLELGSGLSSREPVGKALRAWVKRGFAWTSKDGRAERFYLVPNARAISQRDSAG